jgi:hypothetical protein
VSLHPLRRDLDLFPNQYYIETGCWHGDSMYRAAVESACFFEYYGIEIDAANVAICRNRFSGYPMVNIVHGDSAVILEDVMRHMKRPATILLDAHDSLLDTEARGGFPLFEELAQIQKHPINYHTILIDDVLHLTHPDVTGWSRSMIENALYNINRDYKIEYVSNPQINNFLIARV